MVRAHLHDVLLRVKMALDLRDLEILKKVLRKSSERAKRFFRLFRKKQRRLYLIIFFKTILLELFSQ